MRHERRAKPTERQTDLLRKARNAILRRPETYDQTTYGGHSINCDTPACVAGHIVEADSALREEMARPLRDWRAENAGKPDTLEFRIQQTAGQGLGLPFRPVLFEASWPRSWQPAGSKSPVHEFDSKRFTPSAKDAVKVLDEIIAGRNTLALTDAVLESSQPDREAADQDGWRA